MGVSRIETNRLLHQSGSSTAEPSRRKTGKQRGVQGKQHSGKQSVDRPPRYKTSRYAEGRSPGLRMIHGEHDLTEIGTCAFPCRVGNTGAQWLDADSLIRLPLRGQRGFCLRAKIAVKMTT